MKAVSRQMALVQRGLCCRTMPQQLLRGAAVATLPESTSSLLLTLLYMRCWWPGPLLAQAAPASSSS
jgi:hypothetical protein